MQIWLRHKNDDQGNKKRAQFCIEFVKHDQGVCKGYHLWKSYRNKIKTYGNMIKIEIVSEA